MMRDRLGAHHLGRRDVILLAQREEFRAHGARDRRPVEQRQDDGDAEIDDARIPGDRQRGGERHPERQLGNRAQHLGDALHDGIEQAAEIAGDAADR